MLDLNPEKRKENWPPPAQQGAYRGNLRIGQLFFHFFFFVFSFLNSRKFFKKKICKNLTREWTFSRYVILGLAHPQSGNSVFFDIFFVFLSIFGLFCKKFRKICTVFRIGNRKIPRKFPENVRKCPAGKISEKFRFFSTFFPPDFPESFDKKHKQEKTFFIFRKKNIKI